MAHPLSTIPPRQRASAQAPSRSAEEHAALRYLTGLSEETLERMGTLAPPLDAYTLMTAFPLVTVAWADGIVDPPESAHIVEFCEARGLKRDSASRKTLARWLHHGPSSRDRALFEAFVSESKERTSRDQYERWRRSVLEGAQRVAEAVGGFLFVAGPVNAAERTALSDISVMLAPRRPL